MLDSPLCDVENSALSLTGGAMVAAGFLKRLVQSEQLQWIHLDIADGNEALDAGLFSQQGTSGFAVGTA